jgi:UDP-GlcNAc:undecaprenyl-phosphate GlcNAc-1-phosphate transferase
LWVFYIQVEPYRLIVLMACGGAVCLLGLSDDIHELGVLSRLTAQLCVAVVLVLFGFHLELEFLPQWLAVVLSLLWIVGITNALNIIDIMDGLAAGVALIACVGFAAIAVLTHQPLVLLVASGLAGACLGFLPYSFFPATIYMGDAGSNFLGLILAATALEAGYTSINRMAWLGPILILGVPLMDTLLVMISRARQGRSMFQASQDHFPLRMVAAGMSRRRTVLVVYLVAALLAGIAVLATQVGTLPASVLIITPLMISLAVVLKLNRPQDRQHS